MNFDHERNAYEWQRRAKMVLRAPQLVPRYLYNHGIYNCQRVCADSLALFGFYGYPHRVIFLAGMAMGATTWMKNLLSRIPGYYIRKTVMPYDVAYHGNICDSAFLHVPRHGYSLFKTHLNPTPENLACLHRHGVEKILITHRDLRDVCVSRYYRLLSEPKRPYAPDYVDYASMGREKAMDHSLEVVGGHFASWIRGWTELANDDPDRFCFVRFEDLKADTGREFRKVLGFYGITLEDSLIADIVLQAQGRGKLDANLRQAKVTPFATSSNFRSGKVGEWQSELTAAQKKRAKELFGEMLIEQGYERDLSW